MMIKKFLVIGALIPAVVSPLWAQYQTEEVDVHTQDTIYLYEKVAPQDVQDKEGGWPAKGILDPSVGFLFNEDIQAVKLNISYYDFLLNRLGAYFSAEFNLLDQVDYQQYLLGGSLRLLPDFYLVGGVGNDFRDWESDLLSWRKELGVAYLSEHGFSVRTTFSNSVGFTASVGVPLPLRSDKQEGASVPHQIILNARIESDTLIEDIYTIVSQLDCGGEQSIVHQSGEAPVASTSVFFATDKYEISADDKKKLTNIALLLKQFPGTYAVLRSFTDKRASAEYNKKLRANRTKAVKEFLIQEFDIEPERLTEEEWSITRKSKNFMYLNRRTQVALFFDQKPTDDQLYAQFNKLRQDQLGDQPAPVLRYLIVDGASSELSFKEETELQEVLKASPDFKKILIYHYGVLKGDEKLKIDALKKSIDALIPGSSQPIQVVALSKNKDGVVSPALDAKIILELQD